MKPLFDGSALIDRCLFNRKKEFGDMGTWFTRTVLKIMPVGGPANTAIDPNRVSSQIRENNRQRIS